MNEFLAAAPHATPVAGFVGANISLADSADRRRAHSPTARPSRPARGASPGSIRAPAPCMGMRISLRVHDAHPPLRRSLHAARGRDASADRGRHPRAERILSIEDGLLLSLASRRAVPREARHDRAAHPGVHAWLGVDSDGPSCCAPSRPPSRGDRDTLRGLGAEANAADDKVEDEVLARRVVTGDPAAEQELCRRLLPRVHAWGSSIFARRGRARSLQHVLLVVLEALREGA